MEHDIAICDENGTVTGGYDEDETHRLGLWHQSSHVWIYTEEGDIMLQQRAWEKRVYPGLWDISAAGHVQKGESPRSAAIRETREELGLTLDLNRLESIGIKKVSELLRTIGWPNNEFCYLFFYKMMGRESAYINTDRKEVAATRFIPLRTFRIEITNKITVSRYVPHGSYYLEIANLMEKHCPKNVSLNL